MSGLGSGAEIWGCGCCGSPTIKIKDCDDGDGLRMSPEGAGDYFIGDGSRPGTYQNLWIGSGKEGA